MGGTNTGTQTVSFKYKSNATAKLFNYHEGMLIKPGIYEGAYLTKVDNVTVTVGTMTLALLTPENYLVKVTTSSVFDLTVASGTPYIAGSFTWVDSETNYADFEALASASLTDNHVVLGKCEYTGATLNSFSYSERTVGMLVSGCIYGDSLNAMNDMKPVIGPSMVTFTNTSNLTANSSGVGSIKFKGATSRDSSGFIRIYVNGTEYYIPVFTAITG